MIDIILETIIDSFKIIPFLFISFLIIELIEHKLSKKSIKLIKKSEKLGPLLGGILGCFPQCGFSVLATNLYITRIISLGTLISIYLSTSDEMLPILIARKSNISTIISLLAIKLLIGVTSGIIIDLLLRKKEKIQVTELCQEDECHCEKGIIKSSIIHTTKTTLYLMIITFILNITMYIGGEELLSNLFNKNSIFTPFLTSLIGLIPNCASSVVITELYLNNILSLSSTIAGLLTGSGVAILILFKSNKNLKENIKILLTVYLIGSLSGILIEIINFIL